MTIVKIVTWALLAFVLLSVGVVIGRNSVVPPKAPAPAASSPGEGAAPAASPDLVVFYFHGDRRCAKCNQIEAWTRTALEKGFAGDLASGRIEFRVVNTDDMWNMHFLDDYELTSSMAVLVKMDDGSPGDWEKLDKVWPLVSEGNEAKFLEYVQKETRHWLDKKEDD